MRILFPLTAAGGFLAVFAFAAADVEIPNGDFEDYSGGQFDGWTAFVITGGDFAHLPVDQRDGSCVVISDGNGLGDLNVQSSSVGRIKAMYAD